MSRKQIKHVGIAGNIGAGKTTLARMLAKHYDWEVQYEDVEHNPYLEDFYNDMPRWSFNLQVYFLNSRFRQHTLVRKGEKPVVQDRTIYEDAKIFAPNLHDMGLMTERDFANYESLFEIMQRFLEPPDLLIYLKATIPTLVSQIQKRGREYEENIRIDYLRRLNEFYEAWIKNYTAGRLLVIDVDTCKFAEDQEHFGQIISAVDGEFHGLFE